MAEGPPPGVPERRSGPPRTAGEDFSFREFGGSTRIVRRSVTVGTTPVEVLRANPDRVFWSIHNRSTADGSVDWINGVTTAVGIFLAANTGFISQAIKDDGDAVGWAVYGVSGVAGSTWFVFEIIRYQTRKGG